MSESGRYYIKSSSGKTYCIEPIDNSQRDGKWGNHIPATNTIEKVTSKYQGSITEEESIINKENGFTNIIELKPGMSPIDYIESLEKLNKND